MTKKNLLKAINEFDYYKRHLPHYQIPGNVYFITFRTNNLILNDLSKDIIHNAILFHNNLKYILYSFVVMPDHVHIILQPNIKIENEYFSLAEITHSIKSYSAKVIIKQNNLEMKNVFQQENYDRVLRNENELYEKLSYIRNNPLKGNLIDNIDNYKWYYLYTT